ncbi:hypothetical protein L195_g005681 [Trifolium pratense]|uniref:Uncharacterized protein n=1 Tax=Trifolium pratense TaxID=57577 RepID=A0A2K3P1G0_TRIPR|nr:hypothetical protein L195_g005681 [Trifolium pratense]
MHKLTITITQPTKQKKGIFAATKLTSTLHFSSATQNWVSTTTKDHMSAAAAAADFVVVGEHHTMRLISIKV